MPEVFFANEQVDEEVSGDRLHRLASYVLTSERVTGRAEMSVFLVDVDTMADLNGRFLSKDGPTDVLAFPIDTYANECEDDEADDVPVLLGDVFLCPAVAKENASWHTGEYESELDLLVVHGTLHLLGYDHKWEKDAVRMETRECEILSDFRELASKT